MAAVRKSSLRRHQYNSHKAEDQKLNIVTFVVIAESLAMVYRRQGLALSNAVEQADRPLHTITHVLVSSEARVDQLSSHYVC